MKNFGKILICLILCVFTVGLVGCNKGNADPFFQTTSTYAIGNGGLAVESDGYLYFVNGYLAASQQVSQNASYSVGSLKVAKLSNGKLVTDSEGYLKDDYLRTISDKLCGFEATGLYVFGDYLYFTSPRQENIQGSGGEWAKERVDFYRIKLNKTGNVERIYKSNVNWDSLSYEYYFNGSKVNLVVCEKAENTTIYNIDANSGNVTTVSNKVDGDNFYFGKNNDYKNNGHLFYVERNESGTTYNYVLYNPITGKKTPKSFGYSCTVKYVSNKYVYYTVKNGDWSELKMFAISGDDYAASMFTYAYDGDKTFAISPDDYVFTVESGSIVRLANQLVNISTKTLVSGEGSVTIMGYANGSVIYYNGSDIKAVSYTTNIAAEVLTNLDKLSQVYTNITKLDITYFSVAGNTVYFYATVTNKDGKTNTYLYSVNMSGNVQSVSLYEADDIPEVEEEEIY